MFIFGGAAAPRSAEVSVLAVPPDALRTTNRQVPLEPLWINHHPGVEFAGMAVLKKIVEFCVPKAWILNLNSIVNSPVNPRLYLVASDPGSLAIL
jgi:hypothetical protein